MAKLLSAALMVLSCPAAYAGYPPKESIQIQNVDLIWEFYVEYVCYVKDWHLTLEIDNLYERDHDSIDIHWDREIKKIEDLVEVFNQKVEGYIALKHAGRDDVVHIVNRKLFKDETYPLNRSLTLQFEGPLICLRKRLAKRLPGLIRPTVYSSHLAWDDEDTLVKIDANQMVVRDIITDCLPIKDYEVLLWRAYSQPHPFTPGEHYVPVQFRGTREGYQGHEYECEPERDAAIEPMPTK